MCCKLERSCQKWCFTTYWLSGRALCLIQWMHKLTVRVGGGGRDNGWGLLCAVRASLVVERKGRGGEGKKEKMGSLNVL